MAEQSTEQEQKVLFDSGDSGYAFKTLWKEITKSIQAIGNSAVEGEKAYGEYALGRLNTVTSWNVATTKSQSKNTLLIIILAIVIIGIFATIVFMKSKK